MSVIGALVVADVWLIRSPCPDARPIPHALVHGGHATECRSAPQRLAPRFDAASPNALYEEVVDQAAHALGHFALRFLYRSAAWPHEDGVPTVVLWHVALVVAVQDCPSLSNSSGQEVLAIQEARRPCLGQEYAFCRSQYRPIKKLGAV